MRAMNDAILIGIGTALADDPQLDLPAAGPGGALAGARRARRRFAAAAGRARWRAAPARRRYGSSRAATQAEPEAPRGSRALALRAAGVEVHALRGALMGASMLAAALRLLAGRGITRLMVEGGPRVAASFLAADLVDEAAILRSAAAIGADGIDALDGLPLVGADGIAAAALARCSRRLGEDTLEMFERTDECSPASSPTSAR